MKILILLLILLGPAPLLFAEDALVSWEPSPDSNVTGYQVYHGTASGQYVEKINVGNTTTYTFSELTPGVHYFAVTAYNPAGFESEFSNEASKEIGGNPLDAPGAGGGGGGCAIQRYGAGGPLEAAEMLVLFATIFFLAAKRIVSAFLRSRIEAPRIFDPKG